jgi:hypothetical protein
MYHQMEARSGIMNLAESGVGNKKQIREINLGKL